MTGVGLPPDVSEQLLEHQFRAQQADYARNYPSEGHRIVELDGEPVGRVWIDRRAAELIVVDMALLPEQRSAGIGSMLLREVFADADEAGLPLRMTSLRTNPRAIAIAQRLGFTAAEEDDGIFVSLVRPPVA